MARIDFGDMNTAALGEAPVADTFYELGMMYSIGRSVPVDYVTAHKWFNLAAMRGNEDAIAPAPRDRRPDVGGRDRRRPARRPRLAQGALIGEPAASDRSAAACGSAP